VVRRVDVDSLYVVLNLWPPVLDSQVPGKVVEAIPTHRIAAGPAIVGLLPRLARRVSVNHKHPRPLIRVVGDRGGRDQTSHPSPRDDHVVVGVWIQSPVPRRSA